ncbi:hypothetical protein AKO1_002713, partial [Acrasis kona]
LREEKDRLESRCNDLSVELQQKSSEVDRLSINKEVVASELQILRDRVRDMMKNFKRARTLTILPELEMFKQEMINSTFEQIDRKLVSMNQSSSVNADNQKLRTMLQESLKNVNQLTEQLRNSNARNDTLREEIAKLKRSSKVQLSASATENDSIITQLSDQVIVKEELIVQLNLKSSELEMENLELKSKLQTIASEHEDKIQLLKFEHETITKNAKSRRQRLNSEIEESKREESNVEKLQLTKTIHDLKRQAEEFENASNEKSKQIQEMEERFSELRLENTFLEKTIEGLRAEKETLQNQLSSSKARVAELRSKNSSMGNLKKFRVVENAHSQNTTASSQSTLHPSSASSPSSPTTSSPPSVNVIPPPQIQISTQPPQSTTTAPSIQTEEGTPSQTQTRSISKLLQVNRNQTLQNNAAQTLQVNAHQPTKTRNIKAPRKSMALVVRPDEVIAIVNSVEGRNGSVRRLASDAVNPQPIQKKSHHQMSTIHILDGPEAMNHKVLSKVGYLLKEADRFGTWNKRFFKFDKEDGRFRLMYYHSAECKKLIRVIELKGASVLPASEKENANRVACFQLKCIGRPVYLCAQDASGRDEWVSFLLWAIKQST